MKSFVVLFFLSIICFKGYPQSNTIKAKQIDTASVAGIVTKDRLLNSLLTKEPVIAAGLSSQVYGGDKTWKNAVQYQFSSLTNNDKLKYDAGLGKWVNYAGSDGGATTSISFKKLSFTVGESDAPAGGDNGLTNTLLIGQHLEVYREGYKLDSAAVQGYTFNNSTGAIIFNPALYSNERIVIEASPLAGWSYINLSPLGVFIPFTTSSGTITESPSHTFTGTINSYAVSSTSLSGNGFVVSTYTGSDCFAVPFGLDESATGDYYETGNAGNWAAEIFVSTDGTYAYQANGGSGASSGVTATVGDLMRVVRTGSNLLGQYSSNGGTTWTTFHTFTYTTSETLYPKVAYPIGGKKLVNPKLKNS